MPAQTQEDRDRIKRDRLTAQLRANLQRRKQQARARKADDIPSAHTEDVAPSEDDAAG